MHMIYMDKMKIYQYILFIINDMLKYYFIIKDMLIETLFCNIHFAHSMFYYIYIWIC